MSLIKEIKVFYFGLCSPYICIVNERQIRLSAEVIKIRLKRLTNDRRT
jgi:hypothetical protein